MGDAGRFKRIRASSRRFRGRGREVSSAFCRAADPCLPRKTTGQSARQSSLCGWLSSSVEAFLELPTYPSRDYNNVGSSPGHTTDLVQA